MHSKIARNIFLVSLKKIISVVSVQKLSCEHREATLKYNATREPRKIPIALIAGCFSYSKYQKD